MHVRCTMPRYSKYISDLRILFPRATAKLLREGEGDVLTRFDYVQLCERITLPFRKVVLSDTMEFDKT
ncbi:hypothetical protein X777_16653 [Ooceraea biroi]|uniref:Uncharacterized protein n=1 Tax=Ooceraea biroi TaxID=2015173 RepID=A0A026WUF3_OOCBI|nr:hypothetical protein X777_16653 [Ooceraea biroi]